MQIFSLVGTGIGIEGIFLPLLGHQFSSKLQEPRLLYRWESLLKSPSGLKYCGGEDCSSSRETLGESHCCCHCWQRHSEPSRKMGGIISCFTCSGYILTTIISSDCNTTSSLSAAGRGSVPAACSTGQGHVFTSQ